MWGSDQSMKPANRNQVEKERMERIALINKSVEHEMKLMRYKHMELIERANAEAKKALEYLDNKDTQKGVA